MTFMHIFVWAVILFINLSLFGGYFGHDIDMYKLFIMINLPVWIVYILLFYFNYLFFIPTMLFHRRRVVWYIVFSALLIGLSYISVQELKNSTIMAKMSEEMPSYVKLMREREKAEKEKKELQNTQDKKTNTSSSHKNTNKTSSYDNIFYSNSPSSANPVSYRVFTNSGFYDVLDPNMMNYMMSENPYSTYSQPSPVSENIYSDLIEVDYLDKPITVQRITPEKYITVGGKRIPVPSMFQNISYANTYLADEFETYQETKTQTYGDIVYYYNEKTGVRSITQSYYKNIYNLNDSHNIMQMYLLLIIYAVSLLLGVVEKSQQRAKTVESMNKEKIISELSFLKQQINPHFLFNALNSIYSLVLPHSDEASDVVIKLSNILRYMLYETDKAEVPLEKEISIMCDYLDLQKIKLNKQTTVSYKLTGSCAGHSIEPLLLIPFVENAFKYGVDNVTESFIDIAISVTDNEFIMQIRNKIVVEKLSDSSSGIGMRNVKRRLDLLYNNRHTLLTEHKNNEYLIKLTLKSL